MTAEDRVRHVVYSVAMSLDGFIAAADGGYEWIPDEPGIDWAAFTARFDTVLMGRRSWEVVEAGGSAGPVPGAETVVFSRTLEPSRAGSVTITGEEPAAVVDRLREREGGDVWLMGGGSLFRSLLDAERVDRVEVAVVPVLLGEGIPFLERGPARARLDLLSERTYPSGLVRLEYATERTEETSTGGDA